MSDHRSSPRRPPAASDAIRANVTGTGIAGLSTALALASAGHAVAASPASGDGRDRSTRPVALDREVQSFLAVHDVTDGTSDATVATETRYLARDGTVEAAFPVDRAFTATDVLTERLRTALPGDVVVDVPASEPDLRVAADGWLSETRQRLLPSVRPEYAGYVVWHGTLPGAELPPEFVDRFADAVTLSRGPGDLLAAMLLPGPDGDTAPGRRRLHWEWFRPLPARDLGTALTDRDGVNHDRAVEPGRVQPRFTATLHDRAGDHAPALTRLVRATPDPGVEPVVDLAVPDAVVDDTVLLGDAAFTARQHTASGTTKAVADARTLVAAIDRYDDLATALGDWQATREPAGRALVEQGRQADLDRLVGEI